MLPLKILVTSGTREPLSRVNGKAWLDSSGSDRHQAARYTTQHRGICLARIAMFDQVALVRVTV